MKNRLKQIGKKIAATMKGLIADQNGIGVVEIILVLVILIALVLVFKNQINEIVTSAFESISVNTDTIVN